MPGDWSAEGGGGVSNKPTDHQLVLRAQAGEEEALEELCRASWKSIYRFVAQRCSNSAEAEDLTQSVYLRALSSLPTFQDRGIPFEAYLFRTARNLLVDRWRAASSRSISFTVISEDDARGHVEEHVADLVEDRNELLRAFDRLSPAHQQVLRLRLVEGRSSAEVATMIDSTPTAVRQMQVRAVSALRAAMERPLPRPGPEHVKRKDPAP
jgi:RNA polymerase sigma-70 factor (ECF subfamily)